MADDGSPGAQQDPTELTSRAVAAAKADIRRELGQLREILEARMDAMDTHRELLLQIMDERQDEIRRRFEERDIRFGERDKDRQNAVQAALDAAKEVSDCRDQATDKANEKFEASVREQITQLAALAEAGREQLSTQIRALKERIDRGEGASSGAQNLRTERRLDLGSVVAVLAVMVSAVLGIVLIFKH